MSSRVARTRQERSELEPDGLRTLPARAYKSWLLKYANASWSPALVAGQGPGLCGHQPLGRSDLPQGLVVYTSGLCQEDRSEVIDPRLVRLRVLAGGALGEPGAEVGVE